MHKLTKVVFSLVVVTSIMLAGVSPAVASSGQDCADDGGTVAPPNQESDQHQDNQQSNDDHDLVDADLLNGNAISLIGDAEGGDTGNQENTNNQQQNSNQD